MRLDVYLTIVGISDTDFANKLHISRNHLNGIKKGRLKPGAPLAYLIESITNGEVKADELLKNNKEMAAI